MRRQGAAARSSEHLCPADFTCLFNRRPRQEAGPHNSAAVATATPLLIVAHPLPESFQQLSGAGNRRAGVVGVLEERKEEEQCVCVWESGKLVEVFGGCFERLSLNQSL